MILSNTVPGVAVQGNTVPAAADDNPILGYSGVGNGRNWIATPGSFNAAIVPITAVTGAAAANNLDWTLGGFFNVTQYGGAYTLSFWTTATYANPTGSQVLSAQVGQTIAIYLPAVGSAAITWPSTITWIGSASASGPDHDHQRDARLPDLPDGGQRPDVPRVLPDQLIPSRPGPPPGFPFRRDHRWLTHTRNASRSSRGSFIARMCPTSFSTLPITASASGATTIVPAPTNPALQIVVLDIAVTHSASVNWNLQSHVTTAVATGLFYGTAGPPISLGDSNNGIFAARPGEALDINLSTAAAVGGAITFVVLPPP